MGSICAPSIANLFLSILEELFLLNHKPLFYKRFIEKLDIGKITRNITNNCGISSYALVPLFYDNNYKFIDLNSNKTWSGIGIYPRLSDN